MKKIILILAAMLTFAACTKEGDVIYQTDPADALSAKPLVTVIYDPNAVGDGNYNDLIYQSVEQAAKEHDLRTMHLSPSSRTEGLAYLETLFEQMSAAQDTVRRLFIVAAASYDDYLRRNNNRLAANPYTDLLYLETSEPLDGKWIHADTDDETVTTDMMSVYTFTSDGSALKGYYSMSMTESGVWANRQETDVTVSGNTITLTSHLADGTTSVVEMAGVNISGDDPEYESSEPYRELYRADGTCSYYDLIDGQWVEEETVLSEYFADGPLFCFRWQKPGKELRRENWEIISCENGKMVNKAFLRHADGTTYTITAHLTKVLEKV